MPTPDASSSTPTTLAWTLPSGEIRTGEKDEIMAAYWKGGKIGTIGPAEGVTPTPAPAPAVSQGWGNLTHDAEKQTAIEKKAAEIERLGFALPNTYFTAGTRMMQQGVDTYKQHYAEWGDRPLFVDVLREAAAEIEGEQRQDAVVKLADLHMDATGAIGRKGGPARQIEWGAWGRVYSALQMEGAFPDGRKLLSVLDPATRAAVFNERMAEIAGSDKEVKVGVRRTGEGGAWSIFRIVSPRYPLDGQAHVMLRAMADQLEATGQEWRGHVVYNRATTDVGFDAASMADAISLDPAVGDVFRAGLKGYTNDAGLGRFRIDPFIGRIVCINCTILSAYAKGYEKVHRGSMDEAVQAVNIVADKAIAAAQTFSADWSVLRDTPVRSFPWAQVYKLGEKRREAIADTGVAGALEAMVARGIIPTTTARDVRVERLLRAHTDEPGDSLADVLNAVTRDAHAGLLDSIQQDRLERAAGSLVPVWAKIVRQGA